MMTQNWPKFSRQPDGDRWGHRGPGCARRSQLQGGSISKSGDRRASPPLVVRGLALAHDGSITHAPSSATLVPTRMIQGASRNPGEWRSQNELWTQANIPSEFSRR
jgi:hypothetical protein